MGLTPLFQSYRIQHLRGFPKFCGDFIWKTTSANSAIGQRNPVHIASDINKKSKNK